MLKRVKSGQGDVQLELGEVATPERVAQSKTCPRFRESTGGDRGGRTEDCAGKDSIQNGVRGPLSESQRDQAEAAN